MSMFELAFQDIWHFAGFTFLIYVVGEVIVEAVKAWRGKE